MWKNKRWGILKKDAPSLVLTDYSLEVAIELPVSLLSDYVMFEDTVFSNKLKAHLLQHVLAARIFVDSIGKHYAHL